MMAGDASAYAALGLEPGADSSAIEQAYRRLIKEHHPDRQGGDARRAAEIIEAYRKLRAEKNLKDPLELNDEWGIQRNRVGPWVTVALFLILGVSNSLVHACLSRSLNKVQDLLGKSLQWLPSKSSNWNESQTSPSKEKLRSDKIHRT